MPRFFFFFWGGAPPHSTFTMRQSTSSSSSSENLTSNFFSPGSAPLLPFVHLGDEEGKVCLSPPRFFSWTNKCWWINSYLSDRPRISSAPNLHHDLPPGPEIWGGGGEEARSCLSAEPDVEEEASIKQDNKDL